MSGCDKNKRCTSIELYRIVLMFGICMLHSAGFYSQRWQWFSSSLLWCVDGFVFITGYFGVRPSFSKIVRMYAVALFTLLASNLIGFYCGGLQGKDIFLETLNAFLQCWFIHAYVVLLLLAPLVDSSLERFSESRVLKDARPVFGLLFLAFVWSWLAQFKATNCVVPRTAGLTAYSGITLLGVYAFSRVVGKLDAFKRIGTGVLVAMLLVCICVSVMKVGTYNSPIALVAAGVGFELFRRVDIPAGLSRWVCFISPSMFAVFVFHMTRWGGGCMTKLTTGLVPFFGEFSSILLTALIVFLSGLCVDLIRRFIAFVIETGVRKCVHLT